LYQYQVTATDADGDVLTYTLTVKPSWLNISSSGLISGTPTTANIGDTVVTVRVSDGKGGVDQQSYTLRVLLRSNRAPVITSTAITQGRVGEAYRYAVTATDPDGDVLQFALPTAPGFLSIQANGVVVGTPQTGDVGQHQVVMRVSDNFGGSATQNYTLTVIIGTNNAPVITSTVSDTAFTTELYQYQVTATDADGDVLTYTLTVKPQWLSINGSGLVSGTPTAANVGDTVVTVQVSDGRGGTARQSYTLHVLLLPNRAPVITSTPITQGRVGEAYRYAVTATDPDGDVLQFALLTAPRFLRIQSDNTVVGTPEAGDVGQHLVVVWVSDNSGEVTLQSYILIVLPETDVERVEGLPTEFRLAQNYPNPFNPSTSIEFRVPSFEFVRLSVYDIYGREVEQLMEETLPPGIYRVKFEARYMASGVYFYRLVAGQFSQVKKMSLIK
jgi:hypothetical protein